MDTGEIAEVPAEEQLDHDGGEGSDAGGGGDPPTFLDEVYENPGEVVDEEDLA